MTQDYSEESETESDSLLEGAPEEDDLTTKQLKTLQLIHENPSMSQGELAQLQGVSQSTVSTHLNTLDGFSWEKRKEFVNSMFEDENTDDPDEQSDQSSNSHTRNGESTAEI